MRFQPSDIVQGVRLIRRRVNRVDHATVAGVSDDGRWVYLDIDGHHVGSLPFRMDEIERRWWLDDAEGA